MKVSAWACAERNLCPSGRFAAGLLALGLLSIRPAFAASGPQWIAANPDLNTAQVQQAQGMAGYVLNAETNMNTVYTRKLNRELMNPPNNGRIDDTPLIQYQGPPVQMLPNGPIRVEPMGGRSGSH